jgi:hypothetical protein
MTCNPTTSHKAHHAHTPLSNLAVNVSSCTHAPTCRRRRFGCTAVASSSRTEKETKLASRVRTEAAPGTKNTSQHPHQHQRHQHHRTTGTAARACLLSPNTFDRGPTRNVTAFATLCLLVKRSLLASA